MSGRIRSVKPEILEDGVTAGLSDTAFRLFIAAIVLADDYGNFRSEPHYLRGQVYWKLDPTKDVSAALTELEQLVSFYVVKGQTYGSIRNWMKHQRVSHPGKPRVPGPQEGVPKTSGEPPEHLVPDLRSPISDHRSPITEVVSSVCPESLERTPPVPEPKAAGVTPPAEPSPNQATLALVNEPRKPPERVVYEYWLDGWKRHVRGTRPPVFDDKRRGKIRARFAEGYTVDDLKRAIDGMWASEWHHDHKQWDLTLVCQDASHVDRFLAEAPEPLRKPRTVPRPILEWEARKAAALARGEPWPPPLPANGAAQRTLADIVGELADSKKPDYPEGTP
jgi:hypothetical protein